MKENEQEMLCSCYMHKSACKPNGFSLFVSRDRGNLVRVCRLKYSIWQEMLQANLVFLKGSVKTSVRCEAVKIPKYAELKTLTRIYHQLLSLSIDVQKVREYVFVQQKSKNCDTCLFLISQTNKQTFSWIADGISPASALFRQYSRGRSRQLLRLNKHVNVPSSRVLFISIFGPLPGRGTSESVGYSSLSSNSISQELSTLPRPSFGSYQYII